MLHTPRRQRLIEEQDVRIHLDCYCHTCKLWHRPQPCTPEHFGQEVWEWHAKHPGHAFEFLSPKRRLPARLKDWLWQKLGVAPWWLDYRENTNFKLQFAASAALTCTLASLASSATFVAGREATAIDNGTNRYIDYELGAKITTGTTSTVDKEIRIYGYSCLNPDTPTYPDTITGTDSAVTLTSTYTLDGGFLLMGATSNSATSNIGYPIKCLRLAQAFGMAPHRWGLFIAHSTVAALHATGGNHVITQTGVYLTDT